MDTASDTPHGFQIKPGARPGNTAGRGPEKEGVNMTNTKYYIAYGSNMSTSQMALRCPDAKLVGTGWLNGYRLAFHLHATVERTKEAGSRVPVAIWTIEPQDERKLDRYEGVPHYYTKHTRTVEMMDGSQIQGLIYLMKFKRDAPPVSTYVNGIVASYRALGFENEVEAILMPAMQKSIERYHQGVTIR